MWVQNRSFIASIDMPFASQLLSTLTKTELQQQWDSRGMIIVHKWHVKTFLGLIFAGLNFYLILLIDKNWPHQNFNKQNFEWQKFPCLRYEPLTPLYMYKDTYVINALYISFALIEKKRGWIISSRQWYKTYIANEKPLDYLQTRNHWMEILIGWKARSINFVLHNDIRHMKLKL